MWLLHYITDKQVNNKALYTSKFFTRLHTKLHIIIGYKYKFYYEIIGYKSNKLKSG